jgi:hypothetical protein
MPRGSAGETYEREWHIITCEYPPEIGGVADYTFQIAKSLSERGIRAVVGAPGKDPAAHMYCFRKTPIKTLPVPANFAPLPNLPSSAPRGSYL